jgi:shikimate dehydrogenase
MRGADARRPRPRPDPLVTDLGPPPVVGRLVLLGHPVAHSLSPRFQNAALAAAGVRLAYEAVDVAPAALRAALDALAGARAAGNVTVPHKERVAAACASVTPLAAAVGAVNTYWHDDDRRLVGDNTDVGGFDAAARRLVDPDARPARVALVGAGGSAAAAAVAVSTWPGARVRIWSRTPERAAALAARAPAVATAVAHLADALDGATLVVNATPLGLAAADALPVAIEALPPGAAVLDLVYATRRTRWVRAARAAGHPADDGLCMLVEQGALAFERWFGREPDRGAMWRALADVTRARADAAA